VEKYYLIHFELNRFHDKKKQGKRSSSRWVKAIER
jgi:hypothetical protein